MHLPIFLSLAHYSANADRLVLDAAEKLSDEQLGATSPSRDSIRMLLRHYLVSEAFFLAACKQQPFQFDPKSTANLQQLRKLAELASKETIDFIASLDDVDLERIVVIPLPKAPGHFPIWQLFLQSFLHAAQHRGELSILLSQFGQPLATTDIILQFAKTSGQDLF